MRSKRSLRASASASHIPTLGQTERSGRRAMRALVVDDSSAMRSILKMVLAQAGFEVAEAKNGKDALWALENIGCGDIALVDWNMPEMGGLEFVRAVRADDRYGTMKIMMVTTETDLGQVREALDCGADEYVMKPFTRDSILAKLSLLGF